jgi:hypothetical protein
MGNERACGIAWRLSPNDELAASERVERMASELLTGSPSDIHQMHTDMRRVAEILRDYERGAHLTPAEHQENDDEG